MIANYVLRVEFDSAPPAFSRPPSAPVLAADPLGLFAGQQGAIASPGKAAGGLSGDSLLGSSASVSDPFASSGDDPFSVFAPRVAKTESEDERAPRRATHDPFAPPDPAAGRQAIDPLGLGQVCGEGSVDTLFGLGAGTADPLAGSPLADLGGASAAATGLGTDPLALFGAAPLRQGSLPQRDDSPILNQAVSLPRAAPPPMPGAATPPATPPAPTGASERPPASPGVMRTSWDEEQPAREGPPRSFRDEPTRIVRPSSPARQPQVPPGEWVPVADPQPRPAPAAGAPAGAGSADLAEAFRRGLGVQVALPTVMSAELMEQIGVLLREAIQGTIELLMARAETKREVHAQVTMIVGKDNNPLKFCPDVGFALTQLLVPQGRGFMRPADAMRDAYNDLRAHQFGFMAGMNAALAGVLRRFEPAALERRVVGKSLLDILPAGRKARLWDLFEEMYGEISREAADDFHNLFGREFLKAYEEQVQRLQAERDPVP
nr:type VI secretion system-associated FHA domain protein TagH [Accumulibacter sp.]